MNRFIISLVFIAAFAKSIYFSYFGLNFFDYGETLHNAVRLLEGKVLYRDIWAIFPPGDNYLPAIIITIFGDNILAVRYTESFLFGLFIVIFYKFLEIFKVNKVLVLLAIVAVIFSDLNSYLLYFQLFFFLSLFLFIKFFEKSNYLWLVFSGVFLGVGTLIRHDTGILAGLSILTVLLINSFFEKKKLSTFKKLFLLISGFLVVVAPVVVWLKVSGILNEFLYLGFIKAPQISRILSPGFNIIDIFMSPITYAKLFQQFTLFSYFFYILVYVFTMSYLYRKFKANRISFQETIILSLGVYGLFQAPYAFSVIDMGHLVKAGIPAFVLGIFLIQEGIYKKVWRKYRFLLIAPIIIFILGNLVISWWWIRYNDTRVDFRQGYVFVNSQHFGGSTHPTARTLMKTIKFVEENTREGEYIFAAPYHAMLYFLTERKAPSRFNNFAAGFVSKDEQKEVISDIEKNDVQIVVYDSVNAPLGKRFQDYSPEIHAYIMDNYKIVEETDMGWLLMRRKNGT